jgi:hypothetical protein
MFVNINILYLYLDEELFNGWDVLSSLKSNSNSFLVTAEGQKTLSRRQLRKSMNIFDPLAKVVEGSSEESLNLSSNSLLLNAENQTKMLSERHRKSMHIFVPLAEIPEGSLERSPDLSDCSREIALLKENFFLQSSKNQKFSDVFNLSMISSIEEKNNLQINFNEEDNFKELIGNQHLHSSFKSSEENINSSNYDLSKEKLAEKKDLVKSKFLYKINLFF